VVCSTCSKGKRVNLKADSGVTIGNIDAGGAGTHMIVVSYTNGDSRKRTLYIGVNGGDSQAFFSVFPPTGAWDKVASVAITLSGFRAGTNNVVSFFIDTEQPPPDLDRVEVIPTAHLGATASCDHEDWEATASVTVGDDPGPKGALAAPFATGNGAANTTVVNFAQHIVRAVKIAEVGAARSPSWWQIGEIEVAYTL
jgi:hypothetical protein